MKKIILALVCTLFTINTFAESEWSKTFVVSSGEAASLNLYKGATVRVTEKKWESIGGNTFIINVLPLNIEIVLSEHAGGMASTTSSSYKYNGRSIDVKKNKQSYPTWMSIGGATLIEQKL